MGLPGDIYWILFVEEDHWSILDLYRISLFIFRLNFQPLEFEDLH